MFRQVIRLYMILELFFLILVTIDSNVLMRFTFCNCHHWREVILLPPFYIFSSPLWQLVWPDAPLLWLNVFPPKNVFKN